MFGYGPEELIGMAGDVVYPSRESYQALGRNRRAAALRRAPARRRVGGAAQGRLDLRLPHDRQDARPRRSAAGHGMDRRGHHRPAAPRRRGRAPAARAGGDARHRFGRHRVPQGSAHRALQPALRGDVRLRAGRAATASRPRCCTPTPRTWTRPATPTSSCAAASPPAASSSAGARTARCSGPAPTAARSTRQHPLAGSVWTVEDVTEQRRAEDELQRVLAEQQALLDNVVVGIAISRERKVVRCNRRFEEMFGFGAGDGERRLLAPDVLHRRGVRAARPGLRRARPGAHPCARAMAAAAGRLGLLVPGLGPRRRRRRSGARLRLARRGHQRAPARG